MKAFGVFVVFAATASLGVSPPSAVAETMSSALALAYTSNPEVNRERANVRVQDEDTPKAWGGLRPNASIEASVGSQDSNIRIPVRVPMTNVRIPITDDYVGYPRGGTFKASQTLFDGGRTFNSVRQAEAGVFASRAVMRQTEQATLQNGATAYMNVLRDTAILSLRKNHITVLEIQLDHTRQFFKAGDVTSTDVAQAEAALAQARSEYFAAQAYLKNSISDYHQIMGVDPKHLEPAASVERLLPKSVDQAIAVAIAEHPGVVAAKHQADASEFAVHVAEGALSPTVALEAEVQQQYDSFLGLPGSRQFAAGARATLKIPLYQAGTEYASIRQEKEKLGRSRLTVDVQRNSVRSSVVSSYGRLESVRSQIVSDQAAVNAAELALRGVRQEAQVGQRTTLDVLNAQQSLLNARVNLLISQRDRVVALYAALAAIGRLSAELLKLNVATYDPTIHFEQVKDKWFGVDIDRAK